MLTVIIINILKLLTLNQFWDTEGQTPPEEAFTGPNLILYVFAWIFLSLGIVALTILILYTKYGREISIKLSVLTI